jgi:hypothetical protein
MVADLIKRRAAWIVLTACAALAGTGLLAVPAASARTSPRAISSGDQYAGDNWAGYALTGPDFAFTSVSGSWTQPAIQCDADLDGYFVRFMAGLDGYNSSSVEQIGTEAYCLDSGTAGYQGFAEMPGIYVEFGDTVEPGDQMTASVTFSDPGTGGYTLVLRDATQNWTHTYTRADPGLFRSSAEVIVQDPTAGSALDPLAEFGTVNFLTASVDGTSLGVQHPTQIIMNSSGGVEEVTTSPISSNGAFSSTFEHEGGACAGKPDCAQPTWEPVQYGTSRVRSADSCLAAFSGASSVGYGWQAGGQPIAGATSSSYTIPASLAGQTLTCSVTASNGSGSVTGTSSGAIIASAGPGTAGSAAGSGNAAAERVSATAGPPGGQVPAVGQVPAAGPPVWLPVLYGIVETGRTVSCQAAFAGDDSVSYAWQADGTRISGATTSSYKIPGSRLGKRLSCSVRAANQASSASGTSAAVKVARPALVAVTEPAVSGPHKPGKTEKVTTGRWSPAASTVTYQWYLGTVKVGGATKSTFTVPRTAKKGTKVRCVVTASKAGFAPGKVTTSPVRIT